MNGKNSNNPETQQKMELNVKQFKKMISFLNTKPPMLKPTKIDELEKTEQKMQQFFAPKEEKRPTAPLPGAMPVTLPEPIIKPSPQIITPNPPPITAVIPTVIPPIPEPEKLTEDNVIDYFQNKFESLSNEALEAIKQAIAQKKSNSFTIKHCTYRLIPTTYKYI